MKNKDLIKQRLSEMCTHILFEYNGKNCGIDPLARNEIDMWYDNSCYTAKSVDDAMNHPLFDGKSLNQVADEVKNIEL